MRDTLAALWNGRMPLRRAFWEYAIAYGTLLNAATTIGSLAVLAAGGAGLIALAVHLLPLPYNVFAVTAVWRSAAHYTGPLHWPQLARIAVIAWAVVATVA